MSHPTLLRRAAPEPTTATPTVLGVAAADDLGARQAVLRTALTAIARVAAQGMRGLQPIRTPAPRQRKGEELPESVKLRCDPVPRLAYRTP